MGFTELLTKSLKNRRGYKGKKYSTRWEGDVWILHHWNTDILFVDTRLGKIIAWDGWSKSDSDALNDAVRALRDQNMLSKKFESAYWTYKPVSAPQGLNLWMNDRIYKRDMTVLDSGLAQRKAKKRAKKIRDSVEMWEKRIRSGNLVLGASAGECWGVSMRHSDDPTKQMQECTQCEFVGTKDCGGGVMFLEKVLREKGYRYPGIFLAGSDGRPDIATMQKNWDTIKRALTQWYGKNLP